MWENIIRFLEENQQSCFYKKYFGVSCPGCGLQSALIHLLKGDILLSLQTNPALIPILILFIFLPLHLLLKFRHGAVILKYLFIFTVSIIVINFVIHLIR